MALWGNNDGFTGNGTIAIATTGVVTGTSTDFTNQLHVGNVLRIANNEYIVTEINSATSANVVSSGANTTVVAATNAVYGIASEPGPLVIASGGVKEDADAANTKVAMTTDNIYGVDADEIAVLSDSANGVTHAGWVHRQTYTDQHGRTRIKQETLVAMGSITGDVDAANNVQAALPEDDIFPDA